MTQNASGGGWFRCDQPELCFCSVIFALLLIFLKNANINACVLPLIRAALSFVFNPGECQNESHTHKLQKQCPSVHEQMNPLLTVTSTEAKTEHTIVGITNIQRESEQCVQYCPGLNAKSRPTLLSIIAKGAVGENNLALELNACLKDWMQLLLPTFHMLGV